MTKSDDQSPFEDQTNKSFSNDNTYIDDLVDTTQRRNFSDDSFKSTNLFTNSIIQSPTESHFSFHNTNSGVQGEQISPSRKSSLRFKLPNTTASTPPTTSSTVNTGKQQGSMHNKIGSPFIGNIIDENEVYKVPQSPFADEYKHATFDEDDDHYYHADQDPNAVDHKDTVMQRHRWGTTRDKKGKPKKENMARSKTLKGLLLHNGSIMRSKTKGSKGRNHSIRKPKTNNESDDDAHDDNDDSEQEEEAQDPRDHKDEKRSIVFNRQLPDEFLDPETGKPDTSYSRNKIRTTKYTPLSFLPKNISNQFIHNVANMYFLTLIILGAFDIFGVPNPVLAAVPLIVIVIITAIKDAFEDSRRTVSDLEVNNQITHILENNTAYENPNYIYVNQNINDEKVSLWRRFKKFNTRLLSKLINSCKSNLTKEGKAKKAREKLKTNDHEDHKEVMRKSFDSDFILETPRPSMGENPFSENPYRQSFQQGRQSIQGRQSMQGHGSMGRQHREKTLKFSKKYWKDVKVGDMLRIYNNDEIPADVIILATSDEDNCCYVETKNLDGETNLKVRQALKYGSTENKIKKADDLMDHQFQIDSEGPHPNLYSYQGNLKYFDEHTNDLKQESITINNILLRGCSLRNTKWVIGIVAFTGEDSKIILNAGVTPTKQSRMSHDLNYYVLLNFLLLFVICFVSGLVNGLWYRNDNTSRDYYEFGTVAGSPATNGVVSFFVAVILYQSLVPISLYVTIEIIKTAQAFFIYSDIGMYYERLDYPCTPKSWNISDDLGQIEYIFSDKTGTLTQNLMEFKKCTINGISYGNAYTEALAGLRKRQGYDVETEAAHERKLIAEDREVMILRLKSLTPGGLNYEDGLSFVSSQFVDDLEGKGGEKQQSCNSHFMLALALCHSVLVEEDPKDSEKLLLKAQSPDEAALVETARSVGFAFKGATKKGVLVEVQGTTKEYQVLNTLEFNSTRKRMSAIIKIPGNTEDDEPKALLLCKGADSIIYDRLSSANNTELLETTSNQLEQFATEGLRTLCIAQRELTWSEYLEWNKRHKEAASSLDNRESRMEAVADSIERELILLGGTAIEDRLQDGVPDAISILGQAGIKLWVLTGDKVETAINIGFSCNLLGNDMELLILKTKLDESERAKHNIDAKCSDTKIIDTLISNHLSIYFNMTGSEEEQEKAIEDHSPPNEGFGIVIDGDALKLALLDRDIKRKFLLLCKQCKAVLCCRVSPAQKAAVVKLVKDTLDVTTLAIGDGSNDVAMIQAANVGVGIAGEEGRQAVMSSDYAIGQFRFLARLMLTHGRWSYKRFSEMILSFFYKNVIFSIALFWYGIYNDFDGSYLFEYTYLMFYNLAFTSLPIIFLGILDQDVPAKVGLLVPQLYKTGIMRSEWTETKFWWYMIDAIYQSLISFFFPYLMYYKGFQGMNGLALDHRFWIGIVVTCISCISCNLYILFHQYRWDWWSTLFVSLSILVVFGWTGIWTSSVYSEEFYSAAHQIFGAASFWACTFIGVLACLIPRFFYDFLQKLYWPKDIDIIRECVQRGDFDPYPEKYDPTDPNRPKISLYTNENVKRMSMGNNPNTPPEVYKDSTTSNSDLEYNASYENFGQSSAIRTSKPEHDNHHEAIEGSPDINGQPKNINTESIVHRLSHSKSSHKNSLRKMFKRNTKSRSLHDGAAYSDPYNIAANTEDMALSIQTEEIPLDDFSLPVSMSTQGKVPRLDH